MGAIDDIMPEVVASNRPKPPATSLPTSVARGALQGASAGLGDEVAGGVDYLTSKVPGLRGLAQHAHDEGLPPLTDPNVTYAERRDAYRARNEGAKESHPLAYGAGEFLGATALPGGSAAKMTGLGALSGYGYSSAPDAAGQLRDTAVGAGFGYGAGKAMEVAAPYVGKAADAIATKLRPGAVEREGERVTKALTTDVKAAVKNRVSDEQDRIMGVLAEPEVRKAVGKPEKTLEVATAGISDSGAKADRIYTAADENAAKAAGKAGHGGMRIVADVLTPLQGLKNELTAKSANPAAVNAIDGLITQLQTGLGKDATALVPARDIRQWVTDEVGGQAFKGDPLHQDTKPRQEALQRAYGILKDSLNGYVHKYNGELAANALQKLNDRTTAFLTLKASAEQQLRSAGQESSGLVALGKVAGFAMRHKEEGAGAAIGETVGHALGVPGVGAAAGSLAAHGIKSARERLDQALAWQPIDWAQRTAERATKGLAPPVMTPFIEHVTSGDPGRANAAMAAEVFK